MILFSDSSLLDNLGVGLIVVGLVGAVSLFFFPRDRRLAERSLGVLFTLAVAGGAALTWKAAALHGADRNLTQEQQAALSKAIGQFPTAKFEVVTSRANREAHALALKIADAVKAGSGATPPFDDMLLTPIVGVVLVFDTKSAELEHEVVETVGRVLMGARIAVVGNHAPELAPHTVRIVVGSKP